MVTGSFPGVESGRGVTLTPYPLIVPRSKKLGGDITLLSLRAFMAYKKGETYLYERGINELKSILRIRLALV
jgi:hypothetical protein